MLIFIGLVIVFFIGKFFYDQNEQSVKIGKEGGMMNKYNVLVTALLQGHQNTKVYKADNNSVQLGVVSHGGSTMYIITQTFGNVTVQWKNDSPIFGKHDLEWDFPEYQNQEEMLARIINDVGKYQSNVSRGRNFPSFE
jgi:hypothetical protein